VFDCSGRPRTAHGPMRSVSSKTAQLLSRHYGHGYHQAKISVPTMETTTAAGAVARPSTQTRLLCRDFAINQLSGHGKDQEGNDGIQSEKPVLGSNHDASAIAGWPIEHVLRSASAILLSVLNGQFSYGSDNRLYISSRIPTDF